MKQLFTMGLALAVLFSSCGKNDPIPTPQPPKPTPEQPQTKKPGEEKKPEDPQTPQKPEQPQKPEGPKGPQQPEEPKQPDTPQPKEPKEPEAPQKGPRAEDTELALRSSARWRVSEAEYLKGFDLEALALDANKELFSAQYLKAFVTFEATPVGKASYTFTDEELKDMTIEDIKFVGTEHTAGSISFYTAYKGKRSQIETTLSFDHRAYYRSKLSTSATEAGKLYLTGTAKNLQVFYNNLLNYNKDRYRVVFKENEGVTINEGTNSLSCMLRIEEAKSDRVLATVPYEIKGFRPLSALKSDLEIGHKYELLAEMKNRLGKYRNPSMFEMSVKSTVKQWIKLASFSIKREGKGTQELDWHEESSSSKGTYSLLKGTGARSTLDVWFEAPQFAVKAVEWDDKDLVITLELQGVNDVAGLGIEKKIRVPKVKA